MPCRASDARRARCRHRTRRRCTGAPGIRRGWGSSARTAARRPSKSPLRPENRARGDDDMRRPESLDLLVRRSVVASYNGLFSQLAHVAGQVVDERVVIVDQQDHGTRAAMSPRALSSVSRYSSSGSESATMPPPTWKYTSLPSTRQVRITMLVSTAPESERYPMAPQ